MTTTDAAKRTRGMADAHETARARDAETLHAYLTPADPQPGDEVAYLGPAYSTRTHAINPDTGEFTRLDQETDMTDHRAEAERIRDDERRVVKPSGTRMDGAIVHALLAIHDTLTEIRDRLPEPEGVNAVEDGPTYITEDQPVGTRITDRDGDVWERREDGWSLWHSSEDGPWRGYSQWPWPLPPDNGPFRLATPADTTEEPPVACPTCGRLG